MPLELMNLKGKTDNMTVWEEHIAPNGRTFFFNQSTRQSQWHIPYEVENSRNYTNQETKILYQRIPQIKPLISKPDHQTSIKVIGNNSMKKSRGFVWKNKEDAKTAFKQMLDDLGVHWKATWEQSLKLTINDLRFNIAIKSTNERKSLFIEWSKLKEQQEREREQKQQLIDRENFLSLLQCSLSKKSVNNFSEAESLLHLEPRWNALESVPMRESIFKEYSNRRIQKRKIDEKLERQKKVAALKKYLIHCAWININTSWDEVCNRLEGVTSFENCVKLDRLEAFKTIMRTLETLEEESLKKQRNSKILFERQIREKFKSFLRNHAQQGLIVPNMKWGEYLCIIEKEECYIELCNNQHGSRPKQLFNIVSDEIDDIYFNDIKSVIAVTTLALQNESKRPYKRLKANLINNMLSKNRKFVKTKNERKVMCCSFGQVNKVHTRKSIDYERNLRDKNKMKT
eukprot:gnl/MRDRNA2_/MRDRNA2_85663_c3_seq1.p1 gnl/MRDRNA2_/MRDRNA2_85663_c3~~gnl/MRDRNA2_/MRDRNA2_85663_c3_seq1.p1  ORF type:complete len:492 (-),score=20.57 gnl/MRDRNA2_/MRDRNA2_85663_c3_seq1:220-1590(-)